MPWLRRQQIRWEIFFIVLVLIAGLGIWGGMHSRARLHDLQSKELTLKYAYSQMELEKLNLQQKLRHTDSNSYIVARARDESGYIMDGEIRFEVENPDLLDNYTTDEWQIILDDLRLQD